MDARACAKDREAIAPRDYPTEWRLHIFIFTSMNGTQTSPPVLQRVHTLGDETRTRILALLERGELTVSELCQVLQAPQPTVSRHLRALAGDGWVEVRAEGRNRHYRLAPDLDEVARQLWAVVREALDGEPPFPADAERARAVLARRRRRSEEYFAAAAERWDEVRRELFGDLANVASLFGLLDPTWTVGDLGAGTGELTELLSPFVERVVGIDRSDEMLAAARRRTRALDNVELHRADLSDLPLADGELDLAVISLVLHYVVEPPAALAEARRVLEPGGRLLIVDMRDHDRGAAYAEEMGHVWPGFSEEAIVAWLEGAGFEAIGIRPLPPDPDASGPLLFVATARKPASIS